MGWAEGRNLRIDTRWTTNAVEIRRHAAELAALAPDVILASGSSTVGPLLQATRTVPIVFPQARPGGNVTGFTSFELSILGKSLEILKQIAPAIVRVALIYNPDNPNFRRAVQPVPR